MERSEVRSEPSVCFDKSGCEDMWTILCRSMNQETGHWTLGGFPVRTGSGVLGVSNIPLCPQQPGYKRSMAASVLR